MMLALVQTVGTGEILLSAVTQTVAQTAWPTLLAASMFAAFAGVARPIAIVAAVGSLFFGSLSAPWLFLLFAGVAGLSLGWAVRRPGGRAARASGWTEREPSRPTVVAVVVTLFAFTAAVLPVKAGEQVTLADGAVLVGEMYGAGEDFVAILTLEDNLRFVRIDDIVRRELCRRPIDETWQTAFARFRQQPPLCGRSRVADQERSRDAASPDDHASGESPRD